jgi:hypothetical protein
MRRADATSICVVSPHLMFADASDAIAGFELLLKRRQEE